MWISFFGFCMFACSYSFSFLSHSHSIYLVLLILIPLFFCASAPSVIIIIIIFWFSCVIFFFGSYWLCFTSDNNKWFISTVISFCSYASNSKQPHLCFIYLSIFLFSSLICLFQYNLFNFYFLSFLLPQIKSKQIEILNFFGRFFVCSEAV